MKLEGAIFDFDGTLLDSMGVWDTLGSDFLRLRGIAAKPGLDRALAPLTLSQAAEYLKENYPLAEPPEALVRQINELLAGYYRDTLKAKEGVPALLKRMEAHGVRMYLATATDRPLVEAALKRLKLNRYFSGLVTCAEAGAGKDRPDIYRTALSRLKTKRSRTVVFEDALHAVRSARTAGFRVAAVYDESAAPDSGEIRRLADWYLDNINDWKF